jgi:predicted nuclease of predicted toxin-antitoxin system
MRTYLDDDLASPALAQALQQAGHDVLRPVDVGLSGSDDAVHLRRAIAEGRILLTHNYEDFQNLHDLILEAKGHHPGILVVRRDDDVKRNLKPRDIVRAIARLEAAGLPLEDEYIILNHWR